MGSYTSGGAVKCETMPNQELAEELHIQLQLLEKLKNEKYTHLLQTINIWDVDLADMQLISRFNKEFRFYYALLIFIVNMHGLFL